MKKALLGTDKNVMFIAAGVMWLISTECREAKRESKKRGGEGGGGKEEKNTIFFLNREVRKTRKPEDRKCYADSNKSDRHLTRIIKNGSKEIKQYF